MLFFQFFLINLQHVFIFGAQYLRDHVLYSKEYNLQKDKTGICTNFEGLLKYVTEEINKLTLHRNPCGIVNN